MWNLERFVLAQQVNYEDALREIRSGRKQTHWMWYIFPQLRGLGRSAMSMRYGLDGLEEARAYLAHPVLGPRLLECCEAVESRFQRPVGGVRLPGQSEIPFLSDSICAGRSRGAGL